MRQYNLFIELISQSIDEIWRIHIEEYFENYCLAWNTIFPIFLQYFQTNDEILDPEIYDFQTAVNVEKINKMGALFHRFGDALENIAPFIQVIFFDLMRVFVLISKQLTTN